MNVPLPLVVSITSPVGVMNVPGELSVTMTVQMVAAGTAYEARIPLATGPASVTLDPDADLLAAFALARR